MIKTKSLNFVLCYGVYPYDVMFSLGETDKQLENRLKKTNLHKSYYPDIEKCSLNGMAGNFVMFGCGAGVVRMPNIPKTPFDQDTLAHEIFHAVSSVLRRVGIEHTTDTEEAYAYAISFLTKGAYEAIDNYKKKERWKKGLK